MGESIRNNLNAWGRSWGWTSARAACALQRAATTTRSAIHVRAHREELRFTGILGNPRPESGRHCLICAIHSTLSESFIRLLSSISSLHGRPAPTSLCPSGVRLAMGSDDNTVCFIISQKKFIKSFCKRQFPHKSVNLFVIIRTGSVCRTMMSLLPREPDSRPGFRFRVED